MERIGEKRVIIFGVGGVGSWCAESLVRSGIKHLTIVDSDTVCASNINRQLMATTETIGQVKVDVLRQRLLTAVRPIARSGRLWLGAAASVCALGTTGPSGPQSSMATMQASDPNRRSNSRASIPRVSSCASIPTNSSSPKARAKAPSYTSPPFSATCWLD